MRPETAAEPAGGSDAFERFHPTVRRWVWSRGWTELRDAQERAAGPILAGERDLVISASTASGKTEAAFLPIVSRILTARDAAGGRLPPGVSILYVAPLRALINDQYERLSGLLGAAGITVSRWHSDVGSGAKRRLLEDPSGLLMLTPESLEAFFVRRGDSLGSLFSPLAWAVIDELHAFIDGERGRQVQSQLARLETVVGRPIQRIGLSATIGDPALAAAFLRPAETERVLLITGDDPTSGVRVGVRALRAARPARGDASAATARIADEIFGLTRSGHHLVFANSRASVELYADELRSRAAGAGIPDTYLVHHGSLARSIREEVEERLRDPVRPATAVCTATLELGVDIGELESVIQVGPPHSVGGLRQRLGRSGRRGEAALLRVFIELPESGPDGPLGERLALELVQTAAAIRLLGAGWCEPPTPGDLHLSTLVQQLLSALAQYGVARPGELYRLLAERGPWRELAPEMFGELLRGLARHDLVGQDRAGLLHLGARGEREVEHWSFYAAFVERDEYSVSSGGRTIGSLPRDPAWRLGDSLLLAGRRWQIAGLDARTRRLEVTPGGGRRMPRVLAAELPIHGRVREEMRAILTGDQGLDFLDARAAGILTEARITFRRLGLERRSLVASEEGARLVAWAGTRAVSTLALDLAAAGLSPEVRGPIVTLRGARATSVRAALRARTQAGPADPALLARAAAAKASAKWDWALSPAALEAAFISRDLDPAGAWALAAAISAEPDESA